MFALLGAALAFRGPSEAEANGLAAEMESDESELALQQDTAELMLTYAKICCRFSTSLLGPINTEMYNTCYIQYRSPTSLHSH